MAIIWITLIRSDCDTVWLTCNTADLKILIDKRFKRAIKDVQRESGRGAVA